MNPSYTPPSHGSWDVAPPDHLTNNSAFHQGLPPNPAQRAVEDVLRCQSCGKEFGRLFDLNKHAKTHGRPFKCPVEGCPHRASGWPTEKELDRHFNDRHSIEPAIYFCLWRGCNYRSKRDSNCKLHMERVHGSHHVHNRSGSKEHSPGRPLDPPGDLCQQSSRPRNTLGIRTVPNFLFTPSPLEQRPPLPPDASSPMSIASAPYGPEVHIPWNPPITRLRNNEPFFQGFSQPCAPGTPITVRDSEWLRVPVDPRLYNPSSSGINTPETSPVTDVSSSRDDMLRALPAIVTPKTSPLNSQVLTPISEPSPVLNQPSAFIREATTPQATEGHRGQVRTATQGPGGTGHPNTLGKRQVRFDNEPRDDSDGDDEPPVKRPKTPGGNEEDSGDPKMICPFRRAHPEIYDLNVGPKYFSCHTEHHNISTVVRHLGRPAHNLEVDNSRQAISSFNVTDNEHGHPAAGLCKKCWRSFTDTGAFEAHFQTKCETVSRSKREKFQILLDTFCQIDQRGDSDEGGDEADQDAEGDIEADVNASAGSPQHREDVVSRREYQALADRVANIERMLATRMPQSTPRTIPQHATVVRAFTPSPALPSQAFDYYSYDTGPGPSRSAAGREPRTSGVGGMDTQALGTSDQAVTGFYHDTDQTGFRPSFTRRTDSTSTVRHANPLTVASGPAAQQGSRNQQAISDSAYGTAGASGGARVAGNDPGFAHLHGTDQAPEAFGSANVEASNMDFFNSQGSAEDIAKYLNMDSQ